MKQKLTVEEALVVIAGRVDQLVESWGNYFKESDLRHNENERRHLENERRHLENERRHCENERRHRENERRHRENERRHLEIIEYFKENDKNHRRTHERIDRLEMKVDHHISLSKQEAH